MRSSPQQEVSSEFLSVIFTGWQSTIFDLCFWTIPWLGMITALIARSEDKISGLCSTIVNTGCAVIIFQWLVMRWFSYVKRKELRLEKFMDP